MTDAPSDAFEVWVRSETAASPLWAGTIENPALVRMLRAAWDARGKLADAERDRMRTAMTLADRLDVLQSLASEPQSIITDDGTAYRARQDAIAKLERLGALAPELVRALVELLPEEWDEDYMEHMPGVKTTRGVLAKAEEVLFD